MKIKIDRKGCLEMERAGRFEKQFCPYQRALGPNDPDFRCTHDCPHFGEPEREVQTDDEGRARFTSKSILSICHGTVLRGEIIDERGEQ